MTYDVRTHTAMRGTRQPKVAPHISAEPPAWMLNALCQQVGIELFYMEVGGSSDESKFVCSRCPVRDACLAFAMQAEAGEVVHQDGTEGAGWLRYGVFGGLSPLERTRLAKTDWQTGDPAPAITFRPNSLLGKRAAS
jgi:hypothetical protein